MAKMRTVYYNDNFFCRMTNCELLRFIGHISEKINKAYSVLGIIKRNKGTAV